MIVAGREVMVGEGRSFEKEERRRKERFALAKVPAFGEIGTRDGFPPPP